MNDTEKIVRLSDLLLSAMEALDRIEQAAADENGNCRLFLPCSDCPMRADANSQCKWIRSDEAIAVLGDAKK